ncbi:LamG-like jellyroll fold domain-containing protein [Nocardioides pyridinolyticus]
MRSVLVVGLVVGALSCGCGGPDAGAPDPARPTASPGGARSAHDEEALRLSISFDGGDRGAVLSGNGGTVDLVPGAPGRGLAAAFPERCTAASGCPRALVEVAPDPSLGPGARSFTYGASIWLAADQTTSGANVVQQGRFGSSDGQWKLQVDGAAGRPSCVIRSAAGEVVVRSSVSVADSEWHHVTCRRDAEGVSIEVDGTADRAAVPTGLVGGSAPIRIGSPGVAEGDDQFHGRIDDVFLEVEPDR